MAEMSFEQSLDRIDEIVRALEKGDAALEDSLRMFEEGAGLIRVCEKMLNEAEQKVVKLRPTADGTPEEIPFE